ncbi:hypothetical protein OG921_10905 [Aldersonia sp. NBC_00410]|uniref:hypothetical protein n=1 Tax=Aldersonia sp. NBC_00410 TaxID=2975954 RepID=UPI0022536C68|nr:hypothetical protein [Aldersonia sp. NBC_00410]MCX5043673.1 hypothetical protein [Aldersonia sp. NBC_00410]
MTGEAQGGLAAFQAGVGSGELRIEDGVAEKIAGILDDLAASVGKSEVDVADAAHPQGFGTFGSGDQLQAGFEGKVGQAREHLGQFVAQIKQLAGSVRAAGAAYANQDVATGGAIDTVGEGVK